MEKVDEKHVCLLQHLLKYYNYACIVDSTPDVTLVIVLVMQQVGP